MSGWSLRDGIRRHIEVGPSSADEFNELFVQLARYQRYHSPVLNRYNQSFGKREIEKWSDVQPLPVTMFKQFDIRSYSSHADETVWKSSGTTGTQSKHYLANTTLYDVVIKKLWNEHVYPFEGLTYKLIPEPNTWPDSSLAHFFAVGEQAEEGVQPWRSAVSHLSGSRNFELQLGKLMDTFDWHEGTKTPLRLVGTSYAIAKVFDFMEERNISFVMPGPSQIIDTGGYKGYVKDRQRHEFINQGAKHLGLYWRNFQNEYGMSEMTSHLWSKTMDFETKELGGWNEEWWIVPPWVRVRIVDPVTLEDDIDGVAAFYDLANVWSCCALLTEDLGQVRTMADGQQLFRPLGRAQGAELKGCSLAAERAMDSQL